LSWYQLNRADSIDLREGVKMSATLHEAITTCLEYRGCQEIGNPDMTSRTV
jgi:hypothetical protein